MAPAPGWDARYDWKGWIPYEQLPRSFNPASGQLMTANEKIVGPAFQNVAAKYAGDKDAAASLMQSIQNGSRGKWGRVPMPPHASLSQAELKEIATWVLAQKP